MSRNIFESNSDEPVVTEAEKEEIGDDQLLAEITQAKLHLTMLEQRWLNRKRRGTSGSSG